MRRPWVIGGIVGFSFGVLVVVAAYARLGEQVGVEAFIQYVCSLPMFIALKIWPSAPDIFSAAVFLTYCTALGSFVGYVAQKNAAWIAAAIFIVAILIVGHVKTKIILEDQLSSAATAFANFFLESGLLRNPR